MPNFNNGVGHFTARNIAAVLRAVPKTDGSYSQLTAKAKEYGAHVSNSTLGKWVSCGRFDIRAGERQTAYASFAQHYDKIRKETCDPDKARIREFEEGLRILEQDSQDQ